MHVDTIEPIQKRLLVNAPQQHAFDVFVNQIDSWWPRGHHIGKAPLKQSIIEGKLNGRWYATHEDGSESNTGVVRVWDPPRRIVLTWQITATWQFDPNFETEVEVNFTADGPSKTWVDFEHRHLERYGDAAAKLREGMSSGSGWLKMLEIYAQVAAGETAVAQGT